jgi:hypothetical protein
MQLTTFLSTATVVATAFATDLLRGTAVELDKACKFDEAYARVINRCDYDVHLWSVYKGTGCPTTGMFTLKKGETYAENYLKGSVSDPVGVSIKISKTEECKGNDIVQLEYYIETSKKDYNFNYLDVSYVDCTGGDCPTKQEGYYLVSGNQTGAFAASASNTWCPVMSCDDPISCAKISYINPDDTQTKTCDPEQNIDFYMCGGEAPTEDYEPTPESSSIAPSASSTQEADSSTVTPTPTSTSTSTPAASSSDEEDTYTEDFAVAAAAVTTAPDAKAVDNANLGLTKTKVVYVTAYEYVNVKRHAHDHARRHQPFHA